MLAVASQCSPPAMAQSWSAWKQLAEEQTSKGQLAEAEASWRGSYRLLQQSGSKDSRLFISALELAKVQVAEKKDKEAQQELKEVIASDSLTAESIPEEEISCLKTYLDLCKRNQDLNEFERAEALLAKAFKKQGTTKSQSNNSVTLLFGESAKDELFKEISKSRQQLREKDAASAEKTLDDALRLARSMSSKGVVNLVLLEQAHLYGALKDYSKAEITYKRLLEIVKQDSGAESQSYLEVLGPHARLLRLLGQNEQAALEQTRCELISSKIKLIPVDSTAHNDNNQKIEWNMMAASNPNGNGQVGSSGNGTIANIAMVPTPVPTTAQTGRTGQLLSGRLKVMEFYAVW